MIFPPIACCWWWRTAGMTRPTMCATILLSSARVRRGADPGARSVGQGIMPTIQKASRILGNHLLLRDANAGDADFILQLRTDPRKRRYLSATSPDLARQIAWF